MVTVFIESKPSIHCVVLTVCNVPISVCCFIFFKNRYYRIEQNKYLYISSYLHLPYFLWYKHSFILDSVGMFFVGLLVLVLKVAGCVVISLSISISFTSSVLSIIFPYDLLIAGYLVNKYKGFSIYKVAHFVSYCRIFTKIIQYDTFRLQRMTCWELFIVYLS